MLQFVRSVLFNIAFFLGSTVMCVGLIWTLILPRKPATFFYNLYFRIVYLFQRLILGIKYDIKGLENLPTDRNYIIASKHQSASETMLFPLILKDPAIILKKELLQIPLWGWYAKKAGMIGIDRSAREKALKLMIDGAEKVFAENRPIIVFPQGTRTSVDDQTNQPSYKRGILRLYNNLDCPVVPVALNTGVFWGKNKFFKRAGRATIEFLPPIEQGLSPTEFMSTLQERIEPRSDELVQDAFDEYKARKSFRAIQDIVFFFVTICVLWTAYWTYCARQVEHAMLDIRTDMQQAPIAITYDDAQISGFPFHVRLSLENVKMHAPTMTVTIPELKAHAVPLPHRSLFIESFAPITLSPLTKEDLGDDLVIDHLRAEVANMFSITPMTEQNNELGYRLKSLEIAMGDFRIHAQGHVVQDLDTAAHNGELIFILDGYQQKLQEFVDNGRLKAAHVIFALNMLQQQSKSWLADPKNTANYDLPALKNDAIVVPISIRNNEIYAGMFLLGQIGPTVNTDDYAPSPTLEENQAQEPSHNTQNDSSSIINEDVSEPLFDEMEMPPAPSPVQRPE